MREIFATVAFLSLTSVSQAALIRCSPPQSDVVVNAAGVSTVFFCNPGGNNVNGDGLAITQIRLRVSGTFQENAAPVGQSYGVLFSSINNGTTLGSGSFTLGPVNCSVFGDGDANGQILGACNTTSSYVAVTGAPDSIPAFTVTVTGGSSSTPLPFNASASVAYEVGTTTYSEVPEASAYIMAGIGLIGVYMARRGKA